MPTLYGLSCATKSLPREVWAIGAFSRAAVATTSSCAPAQPGVDRDCIALVENVRDLVEVGITRANDRLPGVDGIRPFLVGSGG